jgi:hypothetical protein
MGTLINHLLLIISDHDMFKKNLQNFPDSPVIHSQRVVTVALAGQMFRATSALYITYIPSLNVHSVLCKLYACLIHNSQLNNKILDFYINTCIIIVVTSFNVCDVCKIERTVCTIKYPYTCLQN